MPIEPEALYFQLGLLVSETPDLVNEDPITPSTQRWLGRATVLVEALGSDADKIYIATASNHLTGPLRGTNAQTIFSVIYRALAKAELLAPISAQGAFIPIGATFDAFHAISKVLSVTKQDALIVDPYLDEKALLEFVPLVPEGIQVRLLRDSEYTKLGSVLKIALDKWVQQYQATRPVQVRETARKALHDRLIVIDGKVVWILTQSLKDLAARTPATLSRMIDDDAAKLKIDFYEDMWLKSSSLT
jgi:hypothetical protein